MIQMSRDLGAALIEVALVLPILLTLIIGALILGFATVEDIRLERATSDAALLTESEAQQVLQSIDGRVLCWWSGSGSGECFDDGLTLERTQIVSEGRTWTHPTGRFIPTAHVSRPIATTTTTTTEGL